MEAWVGASRGRPAAGQAPGPQAPQPVWLPPPYDDHYPPSSAPL